MAKQASPPIDRWVVVIPQKDFRVAKSRMGLAHVRRQSLARAMLKDTLAATLSVDLVHHVLLACDAASDAADLATDRVTIVSTTPNGGLNAAVLVAEETVRTRWPGMNVAVLPADLPYLETEALRFALTQASRHDRCIVPDAGGTGTTLLTAKSGRSLMPEYGPDSCRNHVSTGATVLGGDGRLWSLREDVDQSASLCLRSRGLLGTHTAAEITRTTTRAEFATAVSVRRTVDVPISAPGTEQTLRVRLSTFQHLPDGAEHVALAFGPFDTPASGAPLVRVHSECLTGDLFASLRCDCGPQLREAILDIAQAGGYLLYLRQEGRGIGLYSKIDAYELQDQGFDTFQANRALGFSDDDRDFHVAAQMLSALGVSEVDLLTNNGQKVQQLISGGIRVRNVIRTATHWTRHNTEYLTSKIRAGHLMEPLPAAHDEVETA